MNRKFNAILLIAAMVSRSSVVILLALRAMGIGENLLDSSVKHFIEHPKRAAAFSRRSTLNWRSFVSHFEM